MWLENAIAQKICLQQPSRKSALRNGNLDEKMEAELTMFGLGSLGEFARKPLLQRTRHSFLETIGLKAGKPHQYQWLKGIVAAVFLMNLADGMLTLYWLQTGRAVESNPLMAALIAIDPALFMVVKMALVVMGTALLWRFRFRASAVLGMFLVFFVYYAILIYHLSALGLPLVRSWLG